MTPKQLASLQRVLERRRAEVLAAGPAKIEPNRTDETTVGVADEDAQALSEMMQTLSSQRNKQQAELLHQIDDALRRLRDAPDDFGLCADCEEDIDPRRLAVVPYARLCAECQARRDPKRGVARKSTTDFH